MSKMQATYQSINISKYNGETLQQQKDHVIIEEGLEIRIKYKLMQYQIAITMRTPGQDEYLAIGFLFAEGIIQSADDILNVEKIDTHVILVSLSDRLVLDTNKWQRKTLISSSCGMCGKTSLDALDVHSQYLPWSVKTKVDAATILKLCSAANLEQSTFNITGGNHAVSLFDIQGNLIQQCEDVGRHNAMDKIVGYAMRHDMLPLQEHIVLFSGRASYELIQKATMAGIAIVASVGAPSSLAVQLADDSGLTLIGFLKAKGFNVYSGAGRIEG